MFCCCVLATCFKGFEERLTEELKGIVPTAMAGSVNVVASTGHDNCKAVWIGGQVVASLRAVTCGTIFFTFFHSCSKQNFHVQTFHLHFFRFRNFILFFQI